MLVPPPVAESVPSAAVSFHVFCGMYSNADERVPDVEPAGPQYGGLSPGGLFVVLVGLSAENSVPPMAVTSGIDAGTSTASPCVAGTLVSQSAAPASPDAATRVTPMLWAAVTELRIEAAKPCTCDSSPCSQKP